MMQGVAIIAIWAASVSQGQAEGAVNVITCDTATSCDAAGGCAQASGGITFHIAPINVGPDGAGTFTISYDETSTQMSSIGDKGPFLWAQGASDAQSLIVTGSHSLVWVRNDQLSNTAETLFLTCKDPA